LLAIFIISIAKWQRHNFDHIPIDILEPINVIKNLALVQYWDNSYSINYPAWSVSAEFFAYLVFPILIKLLLLERKYVILRAYILVIIAVSAHILFVISSTVFNSSVVQVLTEFSMGLGTYFLVRKLKPRRNTIVAIRCILASLLILVLFIVDSDPIIRIVIPVIFILICSANYFHNIPSQGLGRKSLVKLGLWSYSIYLTHGLVQYSLSGVGLPQRFNNIFLNILEVISLFVIIVLIGSLTTRIIETPSRKFLLTRMKSSQENSLN
jgi:peptidoglycan/LPS O-acetylase OafA/YrhL